MSAAQSSVADATGQASSVAGRSFVLLLLEARARGFKSTLAFRRWCNKREVPIRKDGKRQWIDPSDVDRAILSLPSSRGVVANDRDVADVVSLVMGRR